MFLSFGASDFTSDVHVRQRNLFWRFGFCSLWIPVPWSCGPVSAAGSRRAAPPAQGEPVNIEAAQCYMIHSEKSHRELSSRLTGRERLAVRTVTGSWTVTSSDELLFHGVKLKRNCRFSKRSFLYAKVTEHGSPVLQGMLERNPQFCLKDIQYALTQVEDEGNFLN